MCSSKTFQSIAVASRRSRRRADVLLLRAVPSPQDIKQRIEAAIPGAHADVEDYTGGGDHFRATVTAAAFEGLGRIEQHRLVYGVFGAEIGAAIHALALRTQTPSQVPTTN
jgi:stress-induced morphogen